MGSCAVYRRTALAQNGGMSLAEHSEDLHTGFDLHRLGWRLRYLPVALSTGNCPDNILAFLNQQYRWCSGTMSLLRDQKFWKTKLPLYSRLCYLTGLVGYVYTAVFTFVAPALAIGDAAVRPRLRCCCGTSIFIVPVLFYAGRDLPDVAPGAVPAGGVVGAGHLGLGARVRAVGHAARPAARLAALGQQARRGRTAGGGFWIGLIGWSFGSAAVWAGPGPVADDDDEPVQLLPHCSCSACSSSWWWAAS